MQNHYALVYAAIRVKLDNPQGNIPSCTVIR